MVHKVFCRREGGAVGGPARRWRGLGGDAKPRGPAKLTRLSCWIAIALLLLLAPARLQSSRLRDDGPADAKPVDFVWAVKIPMRDGVSLNATLFKPKAMTEPLPTVFYINAVYS
jgi:hypothetical protein